MQSGSHSVDPVGTHTSSWVQNFKKVLRNVFWVGCWLLLLWQVSCSVQLYLEGTSIYTESLVTGQPIPLPPITLCPHPPYDPRILAQLGLDLNASYYFELHDRVKALEGVNGSITLAQLVEAASWGVSDLVQELQVGSFKQVYKSKSQVMPKLWSRSFLPWQPCFTLTLPPIPHGINNLSLTLREPLLGFQQCIQEGDPDYNRFGLKCDVVEKRCNTSCVWEDYILRQTNLDVILYGVSEIYKLQNLAIYILNKYKRKDAYLEAYEMIHLEKSTKITMESVFSSIYVAKAEEHNCKILSKKNLEYPISNICSAQIVRYPSPYADKYVSRYREIRWKKLDPKQDGTYLKFDNEAKDNQITIIWKPYVRQVKESLLVPFSALLANVGGSLGMFVGVAVLSIWDWCIKLFHNTLLPANKRFNFISHTFKNQRHILRDILSGWGQKMLRMLSSGVAPKEVGSFVYSANLTQQTFPSRPSNEQHSNFLGSPKRQGKCTIKFQTIGHLIGLLLFTGAVVVQTWLSLMDNFSDNSISITGVSLVPHYGSSAKEDCSANLSLSEAVTGRLASWALGCRVKPPTPRLQCLVKCSLEVATSFSQGFLPFINVEDLPKCSKDTARAGVEYIVPNKLSQHITDEIPKECNKCLSISNKTMKTGELQHKVVKKAKKNPEDLLYDLGGIIGFYLGYSLFGLVRWLGRYFGCWKPMRQRVVVFFVEVVLVLLAAALCVSRLSTFLYQQPILMEVSSRDFRMEMFPAVTICPWPPFNISHLLDTAGHPPLPEDFDLLSPEAQQKVVFATMQTLANNSSHSIVEAWKSAQWDLRDIVNIYSYSDDNKVNTYWTPYHSNSLGLCYTVTLNSSVYVEKNVNLILYFYRITSETREGNYFYIAMHGRDRDPPFIYRSTVFPENIVGIYFDIMSMLTYQGTNKAGEPYVDCIQHCLDREIEKNIGCCLGCQLESHKESQTCNEMEVGRLLAKQWHSVWESSGYYASFTGVDKVTECRLACTDRRQEFYNIRINNSKKLEAFSNGATAWVPFPKNLYPKFQKQIKIVFTKHPKESVEEHVGYTLPQLLSDVGGVIGVVIGASLISVLLLILEKTKKSPKTQN